MVKGISKIEVRTIVVPVSKDSYRTACDRIVSTSKGCVCLGIGGKLTTDEGGSKGVEYKMLVGGNVDILNSELCARQAQFDKGERSVEDME